MTNPRNLKKLIELQKLGSARLEQALAAANARKGALDEEREALIAMQDRRYDGDALNIDPSLLIKRLGNNAAESQQRAASRITTQSTFAGTKTCRVAGRSPDGC